MKVIVQRYFITIVSEEQKDLLNLLQSLSVLYNLEKNQRKIKKLSILFLFKLIFH